jgi:hypothetical protein
LSASLGFLISKNSLFLQMTFFVRIEIGVVVGSQPSL